VAADQRHWSRVEVEAIVADYFEMLAKELGGEPFSKTAHRRQLMQALDDRSDGAIEYKHQNITAALNDLGVPGIDGYKPANNYQDLLLEVVRIRLTGAKGLLSAVEQEVDRAAEVPNIDDILTRLVQPPARQEEKLYRGVRDHAAPAPMPTNYLLKEARNASLGAAGEQFVLNFERARLLAGNRERLATQIEHVSQTRGDHEGFDVLSFETDGRERLIEVKTTAFGPMTPFFVSANQVQQSLQRQQHYHVYRVFKFRKDPHLFAMRGAISQNFDLEAKEFLATPA
jgi:hypothetical protein